MTLYKLLLKEIKQEDRWGATDPLELKKGKISFDFKGKTDDTDYDLKKGDEVLYQNGSPCKIDGEEYVLVSLTQLICLK